MKNEKNISLSAIERIAKNSGVERISKDGLIKMRDLVEEYAVRISMDAIKMARHAKRKTVRGEDVFLIVK